MESLLIIGCFALGYFLFGGGKKNTTQKNTTPSINNTITCKYIPNGGGSFPAGSAIWLQKGVLRIFNPYNIAIVLTNIDVHCAQELVEGPTGNKNYSDKYFIAYMDNITQLDIPAGGYADLKLNLQMTNPSSAALLFSNRTSYVQVPMELMADVSDPTDGVKENIIVPFNGVLLGEQ